MTTLSVLQGQDIASFLDSQRNKQGVGSHNTQGIVPVGATPSSRYAFQTTTHRPEGRAPTKGKTIAHRGGAPTKVKGISHRCGLPKMQKTIANR